MSARIVPAGPPRSVGTESPEDLATAHRRVVLRMIDDLMESHVEREVIRCTLFAADSGCGGPCLTLGVDRHVLTETQWNEECGSQYADAASYNCIEICRVLLEYYAGLLLRASERVVPASRVLNPAVMYDFVRSSRSDGAGLSQVSYEQMRQFITAVQAVPLRYALAQGSWMHDVLRTMDGYSVRI